MTAPARDHARPDPRLEVDYAARVALALDILAHRHCTDNCTRHADQAVLALRGATLDEITALNT